MKISVICPMYNEQDNIVEFLSVLSAVLDKMVLEREIICVNDGSTDETLTFLKQAKAKFPALRIINLSRNFGKEPALTAGLHAATGDVIVPIDADLQDPPELILEMYKRYQEGFDVVLARRIDRAADSFIKRKTAEIFYKVLGNISDVEIPHNVGDYRLFSKKVLGILKQLPESQRFMKGIFSWVGFRSSCVNYSRSARHLGETSLNGWRLWNLALEGITSFSTMPLRVWTYIGALVSLLSFLYGLIIVSKTILLGVDIPGYASILSVMLFLGGVQLIGIGVIGEYVGRIYLESKRRPIYVIENEY